MRTSEKRLLIALIAVLLGGVAYLGFDRLNQWKKKLDAETRQLDVARQEANDMLTTEKKWLERAEWLKKSEAAFSNRKDAELALINLITESAGRHNVSIKKTQPTDPVDLGDMIAATMMVDATADLEKMMDWLHSLQKPTDFLSIPALRLMPDQEDTSKVVISINLQKWFRKA